MVKFLFFVMVMVIGLPVRAEYFEIKSDAQYVEYTTKYKDSLQIFSATWCQPCQKLAPIIKRVAERNNHVIFLKVDIDGCPNAAKINNVETIPTVVVRNKLYPVGGTTEVKFERGVQKFFPKP